MLRPKNGIMPPIVAPPSPPINLANGCNGATAAPALAPAKADAMIVPISGTDCVRYPKLEDITSPKPSASCNGFIGAMSLADSFLLSANPNRPVSVAEGSIRV